MRVEILKQPKDRYIVRFRCQDQREALKQRAARNHRTMNAEILHLIEAGLRAVDSQVSA